MAIALLIILCRLPNIPIPILVVFRAPGLLEPLMLVASVINHQIHEELHPPLMTSLDELLDICDRAVLVGDAVVICDVIAHINLRRLV